MDRAPRLLDLFCGPGGAGEGYRNAGFEVWGVDHVRQRYPFGMFTQADAIGYLEDGGADGFDAIHASPPCQHYSDITVVSGNRGDHADLIGRTRELLDETGVPWIIENVPRAPLRDPVLICGAAVGCTLVENDTRYVLRRHRLFESSVPLEGTGCGCLPGDGVTLGVYGGGKRGKPRGDSGGGKTETASLDQARVLMGMPWATKTEMNQAIPARYTEFLGRQLLAHLRLAAVA